MLRTSDTVCIIHKNTISAPFGKMESFKWERKFEGNFFKKDTIQPLNGVLSISKLPFPNRSYWNGVCRELWALSTFSEGQSILFICAVPCKNSIWCKVIFRTYFIVHIQVSFFKEKGKSTYSWSVKISKLICVLLGLHFIVELPNWLWCLAGDSKEQFGKGFFLGFVHKSRPIYINFANIFFYHLISLLIYKSKIFFKRHLEFM